METAATLTLTFCLAFVALASKLHSDVATTCTFKTFHRILSPMQGVQFKRLSSDFMRKMKKMLLDITSVILPVSLFCSTQVQCMMADCKSVN